MITQRTPLHVASGKGYKYTTEVIVKAGADINIKDNDGVCTVILELFSLCPRHSKKGPINKNSLG